MYFLLFILNYYVWIEFFLLHNSLIALCIFIYVYIYIYIYIYIYMCVCVCVCMCVYVCVCMCVCVYACKVCEQKFGGCLRSFSWLVHKVKGSMHSSCRP